MQSKKAFSIAEAMITLTIVSVIAASAAPMISKQVKINEMSDVQANILNQKIIDLSKTKWQLTPDKKSITRPDDNVGIGVSAGTNPSAKLEVIGNDSSQHLVNLKAPSNMSRNIFNIFKGNEAVFYVNNIGVAKAKGLDLGYSEGEVPTFNYLTTWKDGYIPGQNQTEMWVHSFTRNGGLSIRTLSDYSLRIIDDERKNILTLMKNGDFKLGQRELGDGRVSSIFRVNDKGQGHWIGPKRSEVVTVTDTMTRNDTAALSFLYPEDSAPHLDCGIAGDAVNRGVCTPTTGDGYTTTTVIASNGAVYINSVDNSANPASLTIRNGYVPRTIIRQNGTISLYPTNELDSKAFIVHKPVEEHDNTHYAWIKTDGSAYFAGNVTVGGELANAQWDTKFAKVNEELALSKEMIVQLKEENQQLKEKLVMFEEQLTELLAQQNMEKIAQKRAVRFVK